MKRLGLGSAVRWTPEEHSLEAEGGLRMAAVYIRYAEARLGTQPDPQCNLALQDLVTAERSQAAARVHAEASRGAYAPGTLGMNNEDDLHDVLRSFRRICLKRHFVRGTDPDDDAATKRFKLLELDGGRRRRRRR